MVELESRLNRARELRAQGHNCAQCVAMVFDDIEAVDPATISFVTAGLVAESVARATYAAP